MNRYAILSLAFLTLACNRGSGTSGNVPKAAETAKKLAQTAMPVAPSLDPKDLLTDDKIGRYIIYQREMNTVTDLVMGSAMGAFAKSGGNQKGFEKELSKDDRAKKIADTQASALAKSGLTTAEAMEIVKLATPFTVGVTIGDAEMKKKAREEFSAKYGPAATAVMDKHLPELSKLQDEMMGAVFSKKK